MGINDPFANEASLSGAYYGDMPEDTSNQIGKQSMFAKAKQGLTGLMDNPITSAIGFAINPAFGAIKGIAKGIGSMIPVNQRAIQENVMGNLGFAVNDIGQIVSTGDYDDESGDNVMAGYNLNRMNVDTFKNRISKIRNRKAAQTAASAARIKAIQEAQRKFELGEKLKADALLEAQLKKAQQEMVLLKDIKTMVKEGLTKLLKIHMQVRMEVMLELVHKIMVAEKKMVVLLVIKMAASLRCSKRKDNGIKIQRNNWCNCKTR